MPNYRMNYQNVNGGKASFSIGSTLKIKSRNEVRKILVRTSIFMKFKKKFANF